MINMPQSICSAISLTIMREPGRQTLCGQSPGALRSHTSLTAAYQYGVLGVTSFEDTQNTHTTSADVSRSLCKEQSTMLHTLCITPHPHTELPAGNVSCILVESNTHKG